MCCSTSYDALWWEIDTASQTAAKDRSTSGNSLAKFKVVWETSLYISIVGFFLLSFTSHSRLHSYGDITITGEGLQILTYTWHSGCSEGYLACNTYCDTSHPFIMVISEDPWHSHILPSVWQWSCHYVPICFYDLGLWHLGFNTHDTACGANALTDCATAAV